MIVLEDGSSSFLSSHVLSLLLHTEGCVLLRVLLRQPGHPPHPPFLASFGAHCSGRKLRGIFSPSFPRFHAPAGVLSKLSCSRSLREDQEEDQEEEEEEASFRQGGKSEKVGSFFTLKNIMVIGLFRVQCGSLRMRTSPFVLLHAVLHGRGPRVAEDWP